MNVFQGQRKKLDKQTTKKRKNSNCYVYLCVMQSIFYVTAVLHTNIHSRKEN